MQSQNETNIFGRISNIIMELSKIGDIESSYSTLSSLINSMVKTEEEYFFAEKESTLSEIFNHNYSRDIYDLIKWGYSQGDISMFPEGEGSMIILPISKGPKVLFVYAAYVKLQEFSNEFMMFLRIIAFLMGSLYENLLLYNEILDKNAIIEKNKNFLDTLINGSIDSIIVYDKSMNIYFKNSSYDSISGNSLLLERLHDINIATIDSNKRQIVELEQDDKFYSIESLPIYFEQESFALCFIRDISGTKELEKLKQLDKMKMEFLSMMSHELRTPLSAVKAYSETIITAFEDMDRDTTLAFLTTILTEANHLEKLLNDLLDFSKLELKTLKLEPSVFDIVELINDIINSSEQAATASKVTVSFEKSKEHIKVNLDKSRVRQAVTNILQNAIKFCDREKENSFAKVSLDDTPSSVEIKVEDNGIGINEKYYSKVFEKFFKVDSSLTYQVQGTGIGLSMAKEFIEMHGGSICIEKSLEGIGTTFKITLPKGVL